MTSVTFPPGLGGDGSTVTDDANPSTGLANGGHRTRFVPALQQAVAVMSGAVSQSAASASGASSSAGAAASSASSAMNAPGTNATSTTSLSIGTGSKSPTLAQTGKTFVVGQWVSICDSSTPTTKWMVGAITAFNSGTGAMTVLVTASMGSGSSSSWVVAAAAPLATLGVFGVPTQVSGTSQSMVAGQHYIFTNSGAQSTGTLPASPADGDIVAFDNATGRADLIIARNGSTIHGLAEDINPFDLAGAFALRYSASVGTWRFFSP
jgi:hypothetical protein